MEEMGFSIMRKGSVWVMKVRNSCTEGQFGSLAAAMFCAYQVADGVDWKTAGREALTGSCQ
jgi:hypothetical protein